MDFSNRGASDEMALLLNVGIGAAITAASVVAFELLRLRVPGVYDYRRVAAAASAALLASAPPGAVAGPVAVATAGEWSAAHPPRPEGVLPPPPAGWLTWLRPLLAALTAPPSGPAPGKPLPGDGPSPTATGASEFPCPYPEEAAALPPSPHPDALAVTHGLDVVVALRFLRWQAALFTGLTLLAGGLGLLYRSAASATAAAAGGQDGPDAASAASAAAGGLAAYSLGAVPPEDRLRLWAALVGDIVVTAAVGGTLYWQAAAYARARVAHAARRGAPEAVAVLLTDIPADAAARASRECDGAWSGAPDGDFRAAVTAYWDNVLGAGSVVGVIPAVDPAAPRRAVVRYWAAVDAAEKAEWRAADAAGAVPGRGGVCGSTRWWRLCGLGGGGGGGGGGRRRRHRLHTACRRPVVRPTWVARRSDGVWGCLGWGPAPPEDAVTYWRRQVEERRAAVADAQAAYRVDAGGGPTASAAAAADSLTMEGAPYDLGGDPMATATAAPASTAVGHAPSGTVADQPDGALTVPPPVVSSLPLTPRQVQFRVHWTKLSVPPSQVLPRRLLSLAIVLTVTLFWVAPLTAITGLANARALASVPGLHWLSRVVAAAPAASAFVEGLLPPLLLSAFVRVVPSLLRAAVNLRRLRSRASVDARVVSWLFHFQTTSFLFMLLAGSLASNIKVFIAQPPHMLRVFASSIARQGLFFLQYVLAHALWFTPPELTAWWRLGTRAVRRAVGTPTERALAAADAADAAPDYHALYPGAMVISLVGLVYSTITPALLPACAVFHTAVYVTTAYNLSYAATAGPGDSGGVLFPRAASGVGVALLVKHATMAGFYGTIQWTPGGVVSVVLLVATTAYLSWLRGRFRPIASYGAAAYGAAVQRSRLAELRRNLATASGVPAGDPAALDAAAASAAAVEAAAEAATAVAAYTPPPLVPLPAVVANRNGLTGAGTKAVALGGYDEDTTAATGCGVGGGRGRWPDRDLARAGGEVAGGGGGTDVASSTSSDAGEGDAADHSADTLPLYRRDGRGGGRRPGRCQHLTPPRSFGSV
ncbi:hypothetical protein MMPV_006687 [Pyropia vietnamensis]